MTAHPKVDPATGRMHFFGYGFTPPYLTYYVADADGRLVLAEPVEVAKASMIHDFAITDRHAVFWEGPVLFGVEGPTQGMPYGWAAVLRVAHRRDAARGPGVGDPLGGDRHVLRVPRPQRAHRRATTWCSS